VQTRRAFKVVFSSVWLPATCGDGTDFDAGIAMREHDRHRIVVTGSQSMMIFRAMYPRFSRGDRSARSCLSRTVLSRVL